MLKEMLLLKEVTNIHFPKAGYATKPSVNKLQGDSKARYCDTVQSGKSTKRAVLLSGIFLCFLGLHPAL